MKIIKIHHKRRKETEYKETKTEKKARLKIKNNCIKNTSLPGQKDSRNMASMVVDATVHVSCTIVIAGLLVTFTYQSTRHHQKRSKKKSKTLHHWTKSVDFIAFIGIVSIFIYHIVSAITFLLDEFNISMENSKSKWLKMVIFTLDLTSYVLYFGFLFMISILFIIRLNVSFAQTTYKISKGTNTILILCSVAGLGCGIMSVSISHTPLEYNYQGLFLLGAIVLYLLQLTCFAYQLKTHLLSLVVSLRLQTSVSMLVPPSANRSMSINLNPSAMTPPKFDSPTNSQHSSPRGSTQGSAQGSTHGSGHGSGPGSARARARSISRSRSKSVVQTRDRRLSTQQHELVAVVAKYAVLIFILFVTLVVYLILRIILNLTIEYVSWNIVIYNTMESIVDVICVLLTWLSFGFADNQFEFLFSNLHHTCIFWFQTKSIDRMIDIEHTEQQSKQTIYMTSKKIRPCDNQQIKLAMSNSSFETETKTDDTIINNNDSNNNIAIKFRNHAYAVSDNSDYGNLSSVPGSTIITNTNSVEDHNKNLKEKQWSLSRELTEQFFLVHPQRNNVQNGDDSTVHVESHKDNQQDGPIIGGQKLSAISHDGIASATQHYITNLHHMCSDTGESGNPTPSVAQLQTDEAQTTAHNGDTPTDSLSSKQI